MTVLQLPSGEDRSRGRKRRRAAGVAISAGAHVAVAAAVLAFRAQPEMIVEPEIFIPVSMVDFPGPPDPPGPPNPKPPGPPKPEPPAPAKPTPPVKAIARPTPKPPPRTVETIAAKVEPAPPLPQLTESQAAGAMTADAGSGGGGGGGRGGGGECDMLRKVQAAVRDDSLVVAEVGAAHRIAGSRRPLWVWNGKWLRSPGQDGDGLAALRQAIVWEIAFAPEVCQRERMTGLAVIALNSGGRVAVGSGEWRWIDLLGPRGGSAAR